MTLTLIPADARAEEAVLGACLKQQTVPDEARTLTVDAFHRMAYRGVWQAIRDLDDWGASLDYWTLAEALAGQSRWSRKQWLVSLSEIDLLACDRPLDDPVWRRHWPTAADYLDTLKGAKLLPIAVHVAILQEMQRRRELISGAQLLAEAAWDITSHVQVAECVVDSIAAVRERSTTQTTVSLWDYFDQSDEAA